MIIMMMNSNDDTRLICLLGGGNLIAMDIVMIMIMIMIMMMMMMGVITIPMKIVSSDFGGSGGIGPKSISLLVG